MPIKKLNLSDENAVREKVLSGIKKMAELVSLTLGPAGRSILIERGVGEPLIVDDGRRTAEMIKLDDPIEQLAVRVCYEVTRKTDEKVGDGTTTSMVLTHAIVREVLENRLGVGGMVGTTANVNDIDAEIQAAKLEVVEKIRARSREIKAEKELIDVATVVSGRTDLGEIIGKMYHQLGKEGHITIEFNHLSENIESEVVAGLRFNATYADKFMITNNERKTSSLNDVHVLTVWQKDLDVEKIKPIAAMVQNAGKSGLVIIAPKFTQDFLKSVYLTAVKSKFNILCVRFPGGHSEHYEDIAVWTGGKYFSEKDDVLSATKDDLGYVEKIEVTEEDGCHLIGGKGDKKKIASRIKEVKAEADAQKVFHLKQPRMERISALSGGVGVIRIGASTDDERNWLKYKIEDAKYATKHAYRDGVVKGGGTTLLAISEELPDGHILKSVLRAPYETLKKNAGGKFSVGKNVIDPAAVEIAALKNACSAASKLIRIGGAIAMTQPSLVEELQKVMNKERAPEEELIQEDED